MSQPRMSTRFIPQYFHYGTQGGFVPQGSFVPAASGVRTVPVAVATTAVPVAVATTPTYTPYSTYTSPPVPAPQPKTGFCNPKYLCSPSGLLRLLAILALIGAVTAAAKVPNTDLKSRVVSGKDRSVWKSTLTFAAVALGGSVIAFLMNLFNIVNSPCCKLIPWILLFGLLDLLWVPAMIVLGSFCAKRENRNQRIGGDFRTRGINKGAFGIASAFSLLSGVLLFLLGILGLILGLKWLKNRKK